MTTRGHVVFERSAFRETPQVMVQDDSFRAASVEELRLSELNRWLARGGSTVAVAGLALFLPYGIVFTFLKWAAVLFSPYLVWRLAQLKRFGWVTAFVVVVGAPLPLGFLMQLEGVTAFILSVFPLVAFYSLTLLLKHSVGIWLEEVQWKRQYLDAFGRHAV